MVRRSSLTEAEMYFSLVLVPKDTGLDFNIWAFQCTITMFKRPIIKIYSQRFTADDYFSISIHENPRVIAKRGNDNDCREQIDQAKQFVRLNKATLIAYWENPEEMSTTELLEGLRRIDDL